MVEGFTSAGFFGSDRQTLLKRCRELAADAHALADTASDPQARSAYLDLCHQWDELMKEIEGVDLLQRANQTKVGDASGPLPSWKKALFKSLRHRAP